MKSLEKLQISRCYVPGSISTVYRREIHIFSDASVEAIATVACLKTSEMNGESHCSFVLGKAKLTSKPAHTIPRLELCAAVLAVEIAEVIRSEMDTRIDSFTFYTDSKVVLGYIYNQTKQFHVYVSNRVERIKRFSLPSQWHYVPTELNPADCGTRAVSSDVLQDSLWLSPPSFLCEESYSPPVDSMLQTHKSLPLTHDTLSTFLAEVCAIVNARPLVPVSSDPDAPVILTPASLLTQKIGTAVISSSEIKPKDIYRRQWKQVQHLTNVFWHRWRKEYLHHLQGRNKWQTSKPNLKVGDLILLKDKEVCRNEWPMGLITKVMPSDDNKVRTVEVKVTKGGSTRTFTRPITELVLLLPGE